jgi:nucleoside-diphosphate-sugar epimerase
LTVRVFVAGATGAIGRQLVPRLVAAGHEVHGMTRYVSKRALLDGPGAVPVVADALDPDQVAEAVGGARPEVIVHQLTRSERSTRRPPARCARPWPRSAISSRRVLDARWTEGIMLRYGAFYGPGTSMAPDGEQSELVRRRRFPLVDDDPAPVADWLPALAQSLGAKQPMRVPRFIGRLFAGETGVMMMTELRGASNAKAKRELAWRPAHPSWRKGFMAA